MGGPDHESRAYFRSNHESHMLFETFHESRILHIHHCKKLTHYFALCLGFNTQSLMRATSAEKRSLNA